MPHLSRNTSLKLRPDLAADLPARVAQLNLTLSSYAAILVWNQIQAPVDLVAVKDSPQLARVNVPCYFRRSVAPLLRKAAAAAKLSENAIAEALIARDLEAGGKPLIIIPAQRKRSG